MNVFVASWLLLMGCGMGAQGPDPDVLIDAACGPSALAVHAENLFWLAKCDNSIKMAQRDGSSVRTLVPNEPTAAMLQVDDSSVYWLRIPESGADGELMVASQADGIPTLIVGGQKEMYSFLPHQMVVDDRAIYRSEFSDILEIPKDGSAVQQVFAIGDSGPILATDETYIYWANSHSVYRQQKSDGTSEQLAQTSTVIFQPIAVTESGLFYWSFDGHLVRVDKASAISSQPLVNPNTVFDEFISDGANSLYWQSGSNLVRFVDDGTSRTSVEAEVGGNATSLALDAEFLYWVVEDTIFRAPRSTP